jgi:Flp pilus assembly pilin Flp
MDRSPTAHLSGLEFRGWKFPCRGQGMVEYLIAVVFTAIVLIAVSAPLGSHPSAVVQLADAIKSFWSNYSYILSLP